MTPLRQYKTRLSLCLHYTAVHFISSCLRPWPSRSTGTSMQESFRTIKSSVTSLMQADLCHITSPRRNLSNQLILIIAGIGRFVPIWKYHQERIVSSSFGGLEPSEASIRKLNPLLCKSRTINIEQWKSLIHVVIKSTVVVACSNWLIPSAVNNADQSGWRQMADQKVGI